MNQSKYIDNCNEMYEIFSDGVIKSTKTGKEIEVRNDGNDYVHIKYVDKYRKEYIDDLISKYF